MSELNLIEQIKTRQSRLPPGVIGIGDDAAVFGKGERAGWVIAMDMIMEGSHFDLARHRLEDVGRKSLAVNLSDMAAMAATPRFALVSLGIPKDFGEARALKLWSGLQALADRFGVKIIGGDTNSWSQGLVIDVTILGSPPAGGCVLRSGAQPGDSVYVTGGLGGSLGSNHHLNFEPRIAEALELVKIARPSAMLDLSDGLATDLRRICKASHVRADIDRATVPVSSRLSPQLSPDQALRHALTDGEDFELLFTLPKDQHSQLSRLTFDCIKIGEIKVGEGLYIDGEPLTGEGFSHRF